MNSIADIWSNILERMKGELSETTINTWFDDVSAVGLEKDVFILHCPALARKHSGRAARYFFRRL